MDPRMDIQLKKQIAKIDNCGIEVRPLFFRFGGPSLDLSWCGRAGHNRLRSESALVGSSRCADVDLVPDPGRHLALRQPRQHGDELSFLDLQRRFWNVCIGLARAQSGGLQQRLPIGANRIQVGDGRHRIGNRSGWDMARPKSLAKKDARGALSKASECCVGVRPKRIVS